MTTLTQDYLICTSVRLVIWAIIDDRKVLAISQLNVVYGHCRWVAFHRVENEDNLKSSGATTQPYSLSHPLTLKYKVLGLII